MREVKFRVWIKNKMIYIEKNVSIEFFNNPMYIDWKVSRNYDVFYKHDKSYSAYKESFLMQYTGLKDKNGKEIYEGDLIKHNKNIFQVVHSDNRHVLVLRDIKLVTNWRDLNWCYNVRKYIEIIGNIHKNPGLL